MRPTRTAGLTAIGIAVAVIWAGLGAPLAAVAEPVPSGCPHLSVVGDIDFIDEVPETVPALIKAIEWTCILDAPSREGDEDGEEFQFDRVGASYAEFVALVDALFAESAATWTGGQYTAGLDYSDLDDSLDAWPRDVPDEVSAARAGFVLETAERFTWLQLEWTDAYGSVGSEARSIWFWNSEGADSTDGVAEYEVRRNTEVPVLFADVYWSANSTTPAAPVAGSTGFADPSSVSQLKTVLDAVPTPLQGIVLAGTGTLLTLLVGLPGALLSGVLTARWDRWFGWSRRPAAAVRKVTSRAQPAWLFWIGVVVASVVAAFVDPRFGFNGMSLRLVLTFIAAFAVFNVGAWLLITRVVRRLEPDSPPPNLRLRYGSLVVLLVGVLLSRLLALEPGIVFGVIAGLVYATTLIASKRGVVVLVGAGFAAAAGLSAWIIYSVLAFALGGVDNAFAVGVTEFFGGITIQGISALPIALLPFAVLDGGQLFGWNRAYWGITYFMASLLFLLVMLTVPGGVPGVPGDFLRWLGLYLAFAVIATAIWGIDRLLEQRREGPREGPGLPESEAAR